MFMIWKYGLHIDKTVVQVSGVDSVKPICVQMQNGSPRAWVQVDEVDPTDDPRKVKTLEIEFTIIGTGFEFASNIGEYLGTFQDGWFVGHVFYKVTEKEEVVSA